MFCSLRRVNSFGLGFGIRNHCCKICYENLYDLPICKLLDSKVRFTQYDNEIDKVTCIHTFFQQVYFVSCLVVLELCNSRKLYNNDFVICFICDKVEMFE